MRSVATAAATLAFAFAGPLTASTSAAAPYAPWPDQLPPAPTASNPQPGPQPGCEDPTIACVDRGLQRLRDLQGSLRCDHRNVFATTYVEMTTTLRSSLEAGDPGFADPRWIIAVDHLFHDYYFDAFADYRAGRHVPGAWRVAFRTAARGNANATKDMLLAVNAHVQRDLPFVLAKLGLRTPDGTSRKQDWNDFNHVVNAAYDPIVDEVSSRFDPTLRITNPGTAVDGEAGLVLFQVWRERAWRNAEALLNATTPERRAAVEASIEASTLATAREIAAIPNKRGHRARRDAYCRARWSG
jgi:hypothetical protein